MNTEEAYQAARLEERQRIQSIIECPEAQSRPAKARELALDERGLSLEQAQQELVGRPVEAGGGDLDADAIYQHRRQQLTNE
jgi:hypothetical protein